MTVLVNFKHVFISQIMREERGRIKQSVIERIDRSDPVPKIPIGYEELPLGFFEEYHSSLISNGVTEIHRLYKPRDYARAAQHGGWTCDLYSSEDLEWNLKTFFGNLVPTYSAIVNQNFPLLKDHLALFDGATRVIVTFDVKDRHGAGPMISFWYLRCRSEDGLRIDLHEKRQCEDTTIKLERTRLGESVELDGKSYEYIGGPGGVLDFIYDDMPMFAFIYKELEGRFRRYFNELKEPQQ